MAELCRKNGIPSPEYRTSEVKVLNKIFKIPPDAVPEGRTDRQLELQTGPESITVPWCVVVVFSSAEEEPADSRGGGRDGGACSPECAASLGGDERVSPWSRHSGPRARGDPVPVEPGQTWTATGKHNTKTTTIHTTAVMTT